MIAAIGCAGSGYGQAGGGEQGGAGGRVGALGSGRGGAGGVGSPDGRAPLSGFSVLIRGRASARCLRWVALVGWCPGSFKVKARDDWSCRSSSSGHLVANNTRFLILPGFNGGNLASGAVSLRASADMEAKGWQTWTATRGRTAAHGAPKPEFAQTSARSGRAGVLGRGPAMSGLSTGCESARLSARGARIPLGAGRPANRRGGQARRRGPRLAEFARLTARQLAAVRAFRRPTNAAVEVEHPPHPVGPGPRRLAPQPPGRARHGPHDGRRRGTSGRLGQRRRGDRRGPPAAARTRRGRAQVTLDALPLPEDRTWDRRRGRRLCHAREGQTQTLLLGTVTYGTDTHWSLDPLKTGRSSVEAAYGLTSLAPEHWNTLRGPLTGAHRTTAPTSPACPTPPTLRRPTGRGAARGPQRHRLTQPPRPITGRDARAAFPCATSGHPQPNHPADPLKPRRIRPVSDVVNRYTVVT